MDPKNISTMSNTITPAEPKSKPSTSTTASTPTQRFHAQQLKKLLDLKDLLLDTMSGVAKDNLRARPENSEASAGGMHMADAGSDAYDRDFALSSLSRQSDSLFEIDEAIARLKKEAYGRCEICGKPIPRARLEALPFTRLDVQCQAAEEKAGRNPGRRTVKSIFVHEREDDDEEEAE
jgi:RNA polymerase-binding transcription factor DksA